MKNYALIKRFQPFYPGRTIEDVHRGMGGNLTIFFRDGSTLDVNTED